MSTIDSAISNLIGQAFSSLGIGLMGNAVLIVTNRNYDPLSGQAPVATPTEYPVNCTPPKMFTIREVNGTSIKQGDFKVEIPAQQLIDQDAPPPSASMTLQINGITYMIVSVEPTYVGNSPVLYSVQCRG